MSQCTPTEHTTTTTTTTTITTTTTTTTNKINIYEPQWNSIWP
jgi:hypothetical protein